MFPLSSFIQLIIAFFLEVVDEINVYFVVFFLLSLCCLIWEGGEGRGLFTFIFPFLPVSRSSQGLKVTLLLLSSY